jgi:hypothetical protein
MSTGADIGWAADPHLPKGEWPATTRFGLRPAPHPRSARRRNAGPGLVDASRPSLVTGTRYRGAAARAGRR